jgi:hypothetical protein
MVDRLTTMGQAIFGANVTVSEETIAASTIHIYLDMTNQQVGYSLQLSLASAYRAFTESLLASCNIGEAAELNAEVATWYVYQAPSCNKRKADISSPGFLQVFGSQSTFSSLLF